MGIFSKIWKGVKKTFKKIFKPIKKVFKSVGKFMNKIGIVGQIAMMFIPIPGLGALMSGLGSIGTKALGFLNGMGSIGAAAANVIGSGFKFARAIAKPFVDITSGVKGFFENVTKFVVDKIPGVTLTGAPSSIFGKGGAWEIASKKITNSFSTIGADVASAASMDISDLLDNTDKLVVPKVDIKTNAKMPTDITPDLADVKLDTPKFTDELTALDAPNTVETFTGGYPDTTGNYTAEELRSGGYSQAQIRNTFTDAELEKGGYFKAQSAKTATTPEDFGGGFRGSFDSSTNIYDPSSPSYNVEGTYNWADSSSLQGDVKNYTRYMNKDEGVSGFFNKALKPFKDAVRDPGAFVGDEIARRASPSSLLSYAMQGRGGEGGYEYQKAFAPMYISPERVSDRYAVFSQMTQPTGFLEEMGGMGLLQGGMVQLPNNFMGYGGRDFASEAYANTFNAFKPATTSPSMGY